MTSIFYTFFNADFSTHMFSMKNYSSYVELQKTFRYDTQQKEFRIIFDRWERPQWDSAYESDPEDEDAGLMVFTEENAIIFLKENNEFDEFVWMVPVSFTEGYSRPEIYYGIPSLCVRSGTFGKPVCVPT